MGHVTAMVCERAGPQNWARPKDSNSSGFDYVSSRAGRAQRSCAAARLQLFSCAGKAQSLRTGGNPNVIRRRDVGVRYLS